jgi:hypothetical protein
MDVAGHAGWIEVIEKPQSTLPMRKWVRRLTLESLLEEACQQLSLLIGGEMLKILPGLSVQPSVHFVTLSYDASNLKWSLANRGGYSAQLHGAAGAFQASIEECCQ